MSLSSNYPKHIHQFGVDCQTFSKPHNKKEAHMAEVTYEFVLRTLLNAHSTDVIQEVDIKTIQKFVNEEAINVDDSTRFEQAVVEDLILNLYAFMQMLNIVTVA